MSYDDFQYWKDRSGPRTKFDIYTKGGPEHGQLIQSLFGSKKHILEVGCGYGRLMRLFPFSVGVDFGEYRLKHLHQHIDNPVCYADASKLPFKNKCFEGAYSCQALMHVPPDKIAFVIKEMCRVTSGLVMLLESRILLAKSIHCFAHDYYSLFIEAGWDLESTFPLNTIESQSCSVFSIGLTELDPINCVSSNMDGVQPR